MIDRLKLAALAAGALALVATAVPPPAHAVLTKDAQTCQSAIAKGLAGFKKGKLKAWSKCLNAILKGKPCDTVKRDAAIASAISKASAAISGKCDDAILFGELGFAMNCQLESGTLEPYEQGCYNLPVSNKAQLASCLICWKEGELYEFLKIIFPCLQGVVPTGSDLDCGTPPGTCPAVDDKTQLACLGAISKGATKYLLAIEKAKESCLNAVNAGKIPAPCPDPVAAAKIAKALGKLQAGITKKCPTLPSWWDICPEDSTETCVNAIATVGDITNCAVTAANEIVDELVCWQYTNADDNGITCPGEAPCSCCPAARISTVTGAGRLAVGTFPAFPFPAGVNSVIDVDAGDASCKHNALVGTGNYTVPVFCSVAALNITTSVTSTGCESGGNDGNGVTWDSCHICPDADVDTRADSDDGVCDATGGACTTAGIGGNTLGDIDATLGDGVCDPTGEHTQLAIPVRSLSWQDGDGTIDCPDEDGVYNAGTDLFVSDFNFILRPTTATSDAHFTDKNLDGCSFAGAGPASLKVCSNDNTRPCAVNGDCNAPGTCVPGNLQGAPAAGPCCMVGQTSTVVASGAAMSGGAPLYDLLFGNSSPTSVYNCGAYAGTGSCVVSSDPCDQ